jgi:hypothetical protein
LDGNGCESQSADHEEDGVQQAPLVKRVEAFVRSSPFLFEFFIIKPSHISAVEAPNEGRKQNQEDREEDSEDVIKFVPHASTETSILQAQSTAET